jgi:ribonuclease P protein component
MTLHGRINGQERSRFGISIGKKVGIAVERNRIKRRLREIGWVYLVEGDPVDLVIRPSRGCLHAPFDELGKAFARQLTELRSKLQSPGGAK